MNDMFIALAFIGLTLAVFKLSIFISNKVKKALVNPIIISALIIIIIMKIFNISFSDYNKGGSLIVKALGPIVVVLAIPLYKNKHEIMKNFFPITGGIVAGIITSIFSVVFMCRIFGIDQTIMKSILSKSITTPMAIEATKLLGGNEAVAVLSVVFTGLAGSIVGPFVIKLSRVKSNIAKGIGIGSASHAIGTSKAVEINEEVGAASSLSIGVTGLLTIIAIIIFA